MIWADPFRRARRNLGVKEHDPEFPLVAFTDAATSVLDRLTQDVAQLNENALILDSVLEPTSDQSRIYSALMQTAPLPSIMRVMKAALRDIENAPLDELPYTELRGASYALLGPESARTFQLSPSCSPGQPLAIRYIAGSSAVVSEADTVPPFIPDGYADLLGLMIAEMLWPQGAEASMPSDQAIRMEDRMGQLYERIGKTTPTVARRRTSGDGDTPYLF